MTAPVALKPQSRVFGSNNSSFNGVLTAFKRINISQSANSRPVRLDVKGMESVPTAVVAFELI